MNKLSHKSTDPWEWSRIGINDINDVVNLSDDYFGKEAWPLTNDRVYYESQIAKSVVNQHYNSASEMLIGAYHSSGVLAAVAWFDRGATSVYSPLEICNQRLIHVRQDLSARQKIKLIHQSVEQQILWAGNCGIPVCCNTSIREDQDAFMRIIEKLGFEVRGSFAYARTGDLLDRLRRSNSAT
jgi:hypothetical protein